ncbi:hypothetical protein FQA39_LY05155 [Lamprigera yunnana]|nr:hypothetical protein FQA39_LY05155 [Lamprigera yunnana]
MGTYCFQSALVLNLITLIYITHSHNHNDNLVVQTIYGKIKGVYQYSASNRIFCAFKGIPFAQPPVGKLRFKAPLPPTSWNNIRNAENDGSLCIQKNYFYNENPSVEGEEDCLYLNVYTPRVRKRTSLLPVMVFFHPGGFVSGTGNSDFHGPEFFMDRNIVLVTLNYRVGVLGFLSTLDAASPGNWGLKDQVAALQWVQDNIVVFGGNKKQVTIFGQSAGGASVHIHYFSPLTKGLFHRGIAQSGSALAIWARPQNELQLSVTKKQATFVNCNPDDDTRYVVDCLRNVDAFTLVNSSYLFKTFASEPTMSFGLVLENKTVFNPSPYLIEDPYVLLQNGRAHDVPLILGVVSNEGDVRASPLLRPEHIRTKLNANFSEIGPEVLAIGLSLPQSEIKTVWSKIEDFYLGQNYVDVTHLQSVQGFVDMYSDRLLLYSMYQSALLHAWKGNSSTWFYHFNYRGEYSYEPYFATTTGTINYDWGSFLILFLKSKHISIISGVSHCDDLIYLFRTKKFFGPLQSNSDKLVRRIMTKMWTNFATCSNPTPSNDEYFALWSPIHNLNGLTSVENKHLTYLNITGPSDGENVIRMKMENEYYKQRAVME